MGGAISAAANGLGTLLGNALVAPAKTIFGNTCEGICSGTWDFVCFLENLCIPSLVKLAMVLGLSIITLFFFYLLMKVGIIQCIIGGCCEMSRAACETYFSACQDICRCLWYKIKNTKRVYRGRRFYDIEEGFTSDPSESSYNYHDSRKWRRKRSIRERRKDEIRRSLYPVRRRIKRNRYSDSGSRHHVRLKTNEVSVHLKETRRPKSFKKIKVRNKSKNTLILTRHAGY